MNKDFNERLHAWAEKTLRECTAIATNPAYEMNYVFLPLRSGVCPHPVILFIGSNPGSNLKYVEETVEGYILCNEQNEFLEHYDDPLWKTQRSLTDLFSGEVLRPLYEQAVVTNMVYFNELTFGNLEGKKGFPEARTLCQQLTLELIDILQPQTIITFGKPSTEWMASLSEEGTLSVAQEAVDGERLIGRATYQGIPLFGIHHPSTGYGKKSAPYNRGENLARKHQWFETYYRNLLSTPQ
jgi:hypothetical protein